MNYRLQR